MTRPVVGIDLGGTKIFGVSVDADGRDAAPEVVDGAKRSTPSGSVHEVVDAIVDMVCSLHASPAAIGIGTPGVVLPGSDRVEYAPNLPGFDRPVPLGRLVAEGTGVPVVLGNDVNVAAYGELRAGAGRGRRDLLAVWMGTGLGAGLVLDGRLRVGPAGLAGELGHTVVVPGGRRCGCGHRGHLEAYVGRRAMEERAGELHASGRRTALIELAAGGRMKSSVFRKAYDAGDEVAIELIDEGLEMLAVAIANVAVTVDVSTVVIGGGLGERLADVAVDRLRAEVERLHFAGTPPELARAALGDRAGAIGAALLAAAPADDQPTAEVNAR